MKKLFFVFAILIGITSCTTNSKVESEAIDSVEVVTDSVDTVAVDTVL